jgi:hypothetical protein
MAERTRQRARAGYRRARRLRREGRGVVAVIGTLLSLLVFFALFGIFLTQYVPLWMDENEAQLSNGLVTSLSTLKAGIDEQYLIGDFPSYQVPFTVSSQSVPLFAQPTVATLSYLSGCTGGFTSSGAPSEVGACTYASLSWTTGKTTAGGQNHPFVQTATTNYLAITDPNRYYTPETYYFEDDAILGSQGAGREWMVAPPMFNVTKTAGNLSFQTSLLLLLGNASSFTGDGSKDVTSHLLSHTHYTSNDHFLSSTGAAKSFNVSMTLGVYDLCGWYNYLYNETSEALGLTGWTLTMAGSSGAVATPLTFSDCVASIGATYDITLTISSVDYASVFIAEDQIGFNAGGL